MTNPYPFSKLVANGGKYSIRSRLRAVTFVKMSYWNARVDWSILMQLSDKTFAAPAPIRKKSGVIRLCGSRIKLG